MGYGANGIECGAPFSHSPRRPVTHSPRLYFALVGYSRSNTNSVMNSVRATTEVLAAQ